MSTTFTISILQHNTYFVKYYLSLIVVQNIYYENSNHRRKNNIFIVGVFLWAFERNSFGFTFLKALDFRIGPKLNEFTHKNWDFGCLGYKMVACL